MIVYSLAARSIDRLYALGIAVVRAGLWMGGIRVETCGRPNVLRGRACIFMPNHTSNVDPPALVPLLPRVAILAKKEFFRIPILNVAMRVAGFIPVDRSNHEAAIRSAERALDGLRSGLPFLIYPEGTRSPDGVLGAFKKGAFVLAIKAGVPIVPITIEGAEKCMAKGRLGLQAGVIRITFHPAVETKGLTIEDRDLLAEKVRGIIASALPEQLRGAPKGSVEQEVAI
jgi:1-acyl-sn-glycerol-3-phosphate acyltransferase